MEYQFKEGDTVKTSDGVGVISQITDRGWAIVMFEGRATGKYSLRSLTRAN